MKKIGYGWRDLLLVIPEDEMSRNVLSSYGTLKTNNAQNDKLLEIVLITSVSSSIGILLQN